MNTSQDLSFAPVEQPQALLQEDESRNQWELLAALRFLLATCVVITHSGIVAPESFVFRRMGGQTGYAAVFCFFMISGYSIAASITARRKGFVLRRLRRIYPTLIVALSFCAGLSLAGTMVLPMGQVLPPIKPSVLIGNFFLLQSIVVDSPAQDGALWSLSIEWWLYMIAPLLIAIRIRYTLLLGGLSFLLLCVWGHRHPIPPSDASHVNLLIISWAWLFGFAYYRYRAASTFLLLLVPPLIVFDIYIHQEFSSLVISLTAVAISSAQQIPVRNERLRQIFNWLGNASYPLYLLHVPLLFALAAFTTLRDGNILVPLVIGIVLVTYFLAAFAWTTLSKALAGTWLGQVEKMYRLRRPLRSSRS